MAEDEAIVLFSLNHKKYSAFCYPCDFETGEMVNVELSVLNDSTSEDEFWNANTNKRKEVFPMVEQGSTWTHGAFGEIKNIHPVVVDCGDISFELGDFINDERVIGWFVYFLIDRLDIQRMNS